MVREQDQILPSSGLLKQVYTASSTPGRNIFFWSGDICLQDEEITIGATIFPGFRSNTRLHLLLLGNDSLRDCELWDLQEYNDKVIVNLSTSKARSVLLPQRKTIPNTRYFACQFGLKAGAPQLDSHLLRVSEVDLKRSSVGGGAIFSSPEEAVETLSRLAHALRQNIPSIG